MAKYLKLFFLLVLISTAAFSSMKKKEAERELASMILVIQHEFLNGNAFTIFDGAYFVVPTVVVDKGISLFPNANLTPVSDDEMGVLVNRSLLAISDRNAILFALAHELGHGYSKAILANINCEGINGEATEVVADLGAVAILNASGISLKAIEKTVSKWRDSEIFNVDASGDHPAGDERARLIAEAIDGLRSGTSFADVVSDVLKNRLKVNCLGSY